jgi:hypothetical protein
MRIWLGTGLALTAAAAIAGFGIAQERPNPDREVSRSIPGVQAVAIENLDGRMSLLLVTAAHGPDLPTRFLFPVDDDDEVVVNDEGRDGDRRAGDGVYSGAFRFQAERFERTLRANAERLTPEAFVRPPVVSTRFTPVTARAKGASLMVAPSVTEVVAREQGLAQTRLALEALQGPEGKRPGEVLRVERINGELRAQLLGKPVPIGVIIPPSVFPAQINPDKSLVITDINVVRDPTRTFDPCNNFGNPNGVWTFKHLVTEMANTPVTKVSPETFVKQWLTLSAFPQEANNFISPPRAALIAQLRDAWLAQSGGTTLDLNKAPFRLLAIVARPDLGAAPAGYSSGSAGELRFVFGVVKPNQPCGAVQQSTVIFEYSVPITGCLPTKAWIQKWFNLSNAGLILGSPAYNQQVELLTQQVVVAGANPAQLPNRNAISQIRTNDLIGGPWMLFEYRLDSNAQSNPGLLDLVTVKQTPDIGFRTAKVGALRQWMNDPVVKADILASKHTVPAFLPWNGDPFLGAQAPTSNNLAFTWVTAQTIAPPLNAGVVANFSVATCNGCHTGDTATAFTHIKPRPFNVAAALSAFMRDPGNPAEDDLERRQRFMADALNAPCLVLHLAQNLPPAFVH